MKIELVKKTIAIYGRNFFYVKYDGQMVENTWTTDPAVAYENYLATIEKVKLFPADVFEIIHTTEL